MTIAQWLIETMKALGTAGVDSPRRDALVLLEDVLRKDRTWILSHHDYTLQKEDLKNVNRLIKRRLKREPLAYIRGKAWFYRRFFKVSSSVLIPRPESEAFIDILLELNPQTVIDIGTGSGCLAVTAKLEIPNAKVIATDVNDEALKLAALNAKEHRAKVMFTQGSLLEPLFDFDFSETTLITNLPYVPKVMTISAEVKQEPPRALFAGLDGLDIYKKIWKQVESLKAKPLHILTESLSSQHNQVSLFAQTAGYKLYETKGLVQMFVRSQN